MAPSGWRTNNLYFGPFARREVSLAPFCFPRLKVSMRGNCYHCGLEIPDGTDLAVTVADVPRPMCCHGCQAVAQAIVDSGLTDYYRSRDTLPASRR